MNKAEKTEDKKTPAVHTNDDMTIAKLNQILLKIKDDGNAEYKNQVYMMAASKFTEGINLYLKHLQLAKGNAETTTIVTQIYTNRALSWH